jgi:sterol desaturase/sphingolipid hydroxylase (fatty acid hydroxylase superfamily)
MEEIATFLEPLIPVVIIVSLTIFMSLETIFPYMQMSRYRKKQKWHNIGNILFTFVINALLSGVVAYTITLGTREKFGLLYHLHLPAMASFVIGILLTDLNSYVAHRLYHRVPLFWRFHRVHHSDVELDASSALRLHPFEFVFQAATQATVLPLLGVSNASLVVYTVFALPLFIINHCNIRFPEWYLKYASWIIVTPDWHRIHHSSYQPETDSNFSDVFTIWDRLFSTNRAGKPRELTIGLEKYREPADQTFWSLMKSPFR